MAELHFFTVTAVMVTTTPRCATCGKQEEASLGITKGNWHFHYQNLSSLKKRVIQPGSSFSSLSFSALLATNVFFAAVDLAFPWHENKIDFKGKIFLKNVILDNECCAVSGSHLVPTRE